MDIEQSVIVLQTISAPFCVSWCVIVDCWIFRWFGSFLFVTWEFVSAAFMTEAFAWVTWRSSSAKKHKTFYQTGFHIIFIIYCIALHVLVGPIGPTLWNCLLRTFINMYLNHLLVEYTKTCRWLYNIPCLYPRYAHLVPGLYRPVRCHSTLMPVILPFFKRMFSSFLWTEVLLFIPICIHIALCMMYYIRNVCIICWEQPSCWG